MLENKETKTRKISHDVRFDSELEAAFGNYCVRNHIDNRSEVIRQAVMRLVMPDYTDAELTEVGLLNVQKRLKGVEDRLLKHEELSKAIFLFQLKKDFPDEAEAEYEQFLSEFTQNLKIAKPLYEEIGDKMSTNVDTWGKPVKPKIEIGKVKKQPEQSIPVEKVVKKTEIQKQEIKTEPVKKAEAPPAAKTVQSTKKPATLNVLIDEQYEKIKDLLLQTIETDTTPFFNCYGIGKNAEDYAMEFPVYGIDGFFLDDINGIKAALHMAKIGSTDPRFYNESEIKTKGAKLKSQQAPVELLEKKDGYYSLVDYYNGAQVEGIERYARTFLYKERYYGAKSGISDPEELLIDNITNWYLACERRAKFGTSVFLDEKKIEKDYLEKIDTSKLRLVLKKALDEAWKILDKEHKKEDDEYKKNESL